MLVAEIPIKPPQAKESTLRRVGQKNSDDAENRLLSGGQYILGGFSDGV